MPLISIPKPNTARTLPNLNINLKMVQDGEAVRPHHLLHRHTRSTPIYRATPPKDLGDDRAVSAPQKIDQTENSKGDRDTVTEGTLHLNTEL